MSNRADTIPPHEDVPRGHSDEAVFAVELHAGAYQHDKKVQRHKRLPDLAQEIGAKSGQTHITLDSYIISATTYDDFRKRYDDGSWAREEFAAAFLPSQSTAFDYDSSDACSDSAYQ